MSDERLRAATWMQSTTALPAEAKIAGPYRKTGPGTKTYPFCLPREMSAYSLLPEVRELALDLFAELQIPWHDGIAGGPSNHLLSSQVQCVNALGQMVHDPDRSVAAFGPSLGVTDVLPIEVGRYLTFEFIGPTDLLGEAKAGKRVRGAHCTSVDAAFLHRPAGQRSLELVLVEWKYTESYDARKVDVAKDAVRAKRYQHLVESPTGPIDASVLDFADLLEEPLYQLVRQQLLAHELERTTHYPVSGVRVAHVSPKANLAYQQSLARPPYSDLGATVTEVWSRVLRHPDRFVPIDSAVFLDPAVTSSEYVARYGAAA